MWYFYGLVFVSENNNIYQYLIYQIDCSAVSMFMGVILYAKLCFVIITNILWGVHSHIAITWQWLDSDPEN